MTFTKTEHARYLSHLELARLFIRAFKRAGLNLVYSKGFHPMPKVSFAAALPVGTESLQETVDILSYDRISNGTGREALGRQLPNGIQIITVEDVSFETKMPKLQESHFLITLEGTEFNKLDLERFFEAVSFPVTKKGVKGERIVDAKKIVDKIIPVSPSELKLILRHTNGPALKPVDIVREIFRLKDREVERIKTLKIKQVMR